MADTRAYTSKWHGWRAFATACRNDIKAHRENPKAAVNLRLSEARDTEQFLFGHPLRDADVLDIGPGQVPVQLMYFAQNNQAIGIDVNRIVYHRTPWALLQVARESGPIRAAKTMGRWTLGSDTRLRRSAAECLGKKTVSWPRILQMDARQMNFPDESFDFVYSRSVFQHIADPARAIEEVRRVLKPKGGIYISLHLWTCPNGYTYVPVKSCEWSHLRNHLVAHELDRSRNQLRLGHWRSLLEKTFPGCEIRLRGPETPAMIARAQELRKTELSDYSLEELTSYELSVTWRRP